MRHLATALMLTAGVAHADELTKHRGRCQSLTIADRPASLRCADEMLVHVGTDGERGFLFRADDTVVLFVAIDAPGDSSGARTMPLNRVEFGLRGQVEVIPVLAGSCTSVDAAATWRAETVCEAATLKGRFVASFVTVAGAVERIVPGSESP